MILKRHCFSCGEQVLKIFLAVMETLELLDPESFVAVLAARRGLRSEALLFRYLERKTRAANRGAKARRSLGNVYALLVIAEDFLDGRENGSRFTDC